MEICRRRKSTLVLLTLSLTAGLLIFMFTPYKWSGLVEAVPVRDSQPMAGLPGSSPHSDSVPQSLSTLDEGSRNGRPVKSLKSESLSHPPHEGVGPGSVDRGGVNSDSAHSGGGLYVSSSMPLGPTLKMRHNSNQSAIVAAIRHAWRGYKDYAWGTDELKPLSKRGSSSPFNMGMTLVDCLDTLWLAGLQEEFDEARTWVAERLDIVHNSKTVSTFETTIRLLGGLLSAYHLSLDKLFLDKAVELAQRLLPAFNTPSGVPSRVVHLQNGIPRGRVRPLTVAEAGSLQVELRDVSRASGDPKYGAAGDRDMNVLMAQGKGQMMAMMINPDSGRLQMSDYSVGAGIDSYYEYLLKLWVQSGRREDKFVQAYTSSVKDIGAHLVSHSGPSHLTFIGRARTRQSSPVPVMDHLSCFYPGTLALGLINGLHPEQRGLAQELTHTCYSAYTAMPSGIAPEVFHFNTRGGGSDFMTRGVPSVELSNILRPETVESLFYLHRLTGDSKYRDWGWNIFTAFEKHAKISSGGYAGVWSVLNPTNKQDKMESFFVSETLKYLFLLFTDDPSVFRLSEWVFNTEAHPLPVWRAGQ